MLRAIKQCMKPVLWSTSAITCYKLYESRPVSNLYTDHKSPFLEALMPFEEDVFVKFGRSIILAHTYLLARTLIKTFNHVTVINGDKLNELVTRRRYTHDGKQPLGLLTVSNHTSTLDDPVIFSVILPISIFFQSNLMRWTVCAQEYCAKSQFMSTCFGAGKILPIERGAGRYQPTMCNIVELLRVGDWIHVFPEGRIWQEAGSPKRDDLHRRVSSTGNRTGESKRKLGPLKWGIGRLVTDCEVTPIVLPIFHSGMESIFPQNGKNKLKSWIPRFGKRIFVLVGEPVEFDDLVAVHTEILSAAEVHAIENKTYGSEEWNRWVIEQENKLHVSITNRVNAAMLQLEGQVMECERLAESESVMRAKLVHAKQKVKIIKQRVLYTKYRLVGKVGDITNRVTQKAKRATSRVREAARNASIVVPKTALAEDVVPYIKLK